MPEMKRCTKCGIEKPATLEFFGIHSGQHDKLHYYCKFCAQQQQKLQRERRRLGIVQEVTELRSSGKRRCRLCKVVYLLNSENFYQLKDGRFMQECIPCRRSLSRDRNRALAADPRSAEAERQRKNTSAKRLRALNPESYRQREKLWRFANLEKCRARNRLYKFKNADAVRERQRLQKRAAYAKDPLKFKAVNAKNRASRSQAAGEYSGKELRDKLISQGFKCFYCECDLHRKKWHADHFIPLCKGGTNATDNIVISCPECNQRKYSKLPHEFMPDKFKAVEHP